MAITRFEQGDTRQFTFVSSVAPNSAPGFSVSTPDGTLVSSFTSTQSDSTHYYAMFTMPSSNAEYIGKWHAEKTVASSTRDFVARFVFRVNETRP